MGLVESISTFIAFYSYVTNIATTFSGRITGKVDRSMWIASARLTSGVIIKVIIAAIATYAFEIGLAIALKLAVAGNTI